MAAHGSHSASSPPTAQPADEESDVAESVVDVAASCPACGGGSAMSASAIGLDTPASPGGTAPLPSTVSAQAVAGGPAKEADVSSTELTQVTDFARQLRESGVNRVGLALVNTLGGAVWRGDSTLTFGLTNREVFRLTPEGVYRGTKGPRLAKSDAQELLPAIFRGVFGAAVPVHEGAYGRLRKVHRSRFQRRQSSAVQRFQEASSHES